jgi:hypothetical protein
MTHRPASPIELQMATGSEPGSMVTKRASRRKAADPAVSPQRAAKPRPRGSTLSVTVATQRSGTKLLGNCLNAGVKVRSLGEVFHQEASPVYAFGSYLTRQPTLTQDFALGRTWELLDRYTLELSAIAPYVHFDLMYGNLSYLAPLWLSRSSGLPMLDYLMSRSVGIVHLTRDPADTYISGIVARCTTIYHSSVDVGAVATEVSDSDIRQAMLAEPFSAYLEQTLRSREAVRQTLVGYPYALELDYQGLVDRDGFLTRGAREQLATVLTNGDDPRWLQVAPTSMRRPQVDDSIYERVRERLERT